MTRVERARGAPGWWWRSRTSDPAAASLHDLEGVLLSLTEEEWTSLSQPISKDSQGRLVTGDPVADEWERAAWEAARGG